MYSCSNYRVPKYEQIIKWNDKDLKIKWGLKKPILSKRDQNAQSFRDFFKKNKSSITGFIIHMKFFKLKNEK